MFALKSPIQVNSATHEWPTVRKCERAVILGCLRRAISRSSPQNRREITAVEGHEKEPTADCGL